MYRSISLELAAGELRRDYGARAAEIAALAPDCVLLAGEDLNGHLAPPRLEALVDIAWITGILTSPVVVAGLPALHAVPFHIARALSAAEFMCGGRSGWMPLLGEGARFDAAHGTALADRPDAAARADDFIRATQALWDSWDDDALILDQAGGRYLDSSKVRRVEYRGAFYATKGPLNAARPPQGHPLLVRDLVDRPDSSMPADIVIGDAAALATIPAGPVRLLRTLGDLTAAHALVANGAVDGLHFAGPDALTMLRSFPGTAYATTGRARFALPHPVNPFSAGSMAR